MRRRLGFQGSILLGLLATSALVLVLVLYFSFRFVEEVFAFGINPRVEAMVQAPLDVYPELFKTRRALHQVRADLAAATLGSVSTEDGETVRSALAALCRDDRFLVHASLTPADEVPYEVRCPLPADAPEVREQTLTRPLLAGAELRLTYGMEEFHFERFHDAGELTALYRQLGDQRDDLLEAYGLAFSTILGAWVLLGGGLAIFLTRRTTRRLAVLLEATRRVSTGDLQARAEVGGDDELSDLADSFNQMVREIGERRERMVYLERVSTWQEIARRLAHEIKNPLTPIKLAMQQLSSRYDGSDDKFARLLAEVDDIVREEVETLRRLVTEFSEFARLPDVSVEATDLARYVKEFVRQHPDLAENAAIDLDAPQQPVGARIDRTLMRRVLTNLIENAIQAAEEVGEIPRVHLTVATTNGWALLSVSDEGPGIPPDNLATIFDPYFTTKETGTGLGLAICKKIVLQHDGEISASPREGGGTRFEIRFRRSDATTET